MKAWILLMLFLLIGCRSAKKEVSNSINELNTITDATSEKKLYQNVDSRSARFIDRSIREVDFGGLKIYPKGEFTIDASGVFTGSADSVINTTTRLVDTHQKESDSSSFTAEKNAVESTQASTTVESKTEESHKAIKRTPSLIPYIGIGLILIGLIAFVMWRLKIL